MPLVLRSSSAWLRGFNLPLPFSPPFHQPSMSSRPHHPVRGGGSEAAGQDWGDTRFRGETPQLTAPPSQPHSPEPERHALDTTQPGLLNSIAWCWVGPLRGLDSTGRHHAWAGALTDTSAHCVCCLSWCLDVLTLDRQRPPTGCTSRSPSSYVRLAALVVSAVEADEC